MKWALLAQCTGLVLAVLVLALLVRMTDGPAREVRQAIRRLSRGDLDVRLDAAMERRGDALARVAGEFNAMVESLANRHREQHLLFGEISHEMRTPLSRLALAAEMARGGGDERSIRLLELVRRDTERLDGLARQMLALARMEHHAGERAPVDLGVLLEELAETCSFEAAGHGRAVVVERDAGCGACMVLGDREQLSSMVENVLRNGVRHTPRGSCVHVRLEEQEHAGRPMAVVHVRDSGAGVPEEELARIFEPFYRGSACAGNDDDPAVGPGAGTGDPGGPTGGAGLGLAIARHVAVAHAGRISARNVPQGGLEVVIRLPLASAASDDDDVAGRRAAEPDPTDSGAPSGPASRPQKPHQDPPHSPARCRAADLLRTAHGRRFKATA
jgi:two-component system sensor histidine kinase CpxA